LISFAAFGSKASHLKDFFKLTLYQLIYFMLRCFPVRRENNHLLLVKTDEIGDYMLMRNLLPLFREAGPYKDFKITFVGNIAFRQLFNQYDRQVADRVIWLNKKKFSANPWYRFRLLLQIRRVPASDAVSLVYSRIWRKDDVIIALCAATARTAMKNNTRLITSYERRLTPRHIYTRLEDCGGENLFDAIRNARFVERLLQRPVQPVSISIDVRADIGSLGLPPAYFVVFPGSGVPQKKWPAASFSAVARHLADRCGLFPVVCGSGADRADCNEFIREYGAPVLDLTARTTLPQLLAVLKGATCLISVDTGSVHLAAAVGCPVFALYSGLHYGRFAPYPETLASRFYPFYPESFERMLKGDRPIDFEMIPIDLLKEISVDRVVAGIDAHLPDICRERAFPVIDPGTASSCKCHTE
jgi:ADP-heptose:LPS heptosyltransferase